MKKFVFAVLSIALIVFAVSADEQLVRQLFIYKNGELVNSVDVDKIDSATIDTDEQLIHQFSIYENGNAIFAIDVDGIDSVKFDKRIEVVEDEYNIYHYGNCKISSSHGYLLGTKNEIFDLGAATLIDADKIKAVGDKIVGYRIYIGGNNVSKTSIFLGYDYKNPTFTKNFTYKEGGWNVVMLDEPMVIPEKNFYVGYKITSDGYSCGMEQGVYRDGEMFFFDGVWYTVYDIAGENCINSIQLLVTGGDYSSYIQKDIAIENVEIDKEGKGNQPLSVKCEVRNYGVATANGVNVVCMFGGKKYVYEVEEPVVHGRTIVVDMPNVVCPDLAGNQSISLDIEWSAKDDNVANNKYSGQVSVFASDAPERVAILLEQFTGQGCGYCPDGAVALANAIAGLSEENQNKVIWVAHHNYYVDAFTLDESLTIGSAMGVRVAPALVVNREKHTNPIGVSELVWNPSYVTA